MAAISDAEMNHGHDRYQNGLVARCGGPGMCHVCKQEFDQYGLSEFVQLQQRVRRSEDVLNKLLHSARYGSEHSPTYIAELVLKALAALRQG